jgi:hypothetical protein
VGWARHIAVNAGPSSSSVRLGIPRDCGCRHLIPSSIAGARSESQTLLGGGARALANEVRAAKYAGVRLLLEADDNPVGAILLISSLRRIGDREQPFSDLSGWYVEPGFRGHATQLFKRAPANKQTTYLSVSAATHIWRIIEAFA